MNLLKSPRDISFALKCAPYPWIQRLFSVGIDSGEKFDQLIEAKDYPEFERELPGARLSTKERMYFEGILADRLNRPAPG
jgi:hypothetical protein